MIGWLIAGAGLEGAVLGALVWWYRRRALRAEALAAQVDEVKAAAADERARLQGATHVLDTTFERYQRAIEQELVAPRPELAGVYLGIVVRLQAAAAGAPHAPVPGAPGTPRT